MKWLILEILLKIYFFLDIHLMVFQIMRMLEKKVVDYFSSFDNSIIDFKVEKLKEDEDDNEHLKINTVHRLINSDETVTLPLQDESAGTLKMFALYPSLQEVMETGGVLFVDELNSRLHPLLVRNFLIKFS